MLPWRLYYGDGATYDLSDGPADRSPPVDVQVIVQPDPDVGRILIAKHHNYWLDQGVWYGGNDFGLFDYLTRPGMKLVRFGRTIANDAFRALFERAANDPDFPRKSGWHPWEKR